MAIATDSVAISIVSEYRQSIASFAYAGMLTYYGCIYSLWVYTHSLLLLLHLLRPCLLCPSASLLTYHSLLATRQEVEEDHHGGPLRARGRGVHEQHLLPGHLHGAVLLQAARVEVLGRDVHHAAHRGDPTTTTNYLPLPTTTYYYYLLLSTHCLLLTTHYLGGRGVLRDEEDADLLRRRAHPQVRSK